MRPSFAYTLCADFLILRFAATFNPQATFGNPLPCAPIMVRDLCGKMVLLVRGDILLNRELQDVFLAMLRCIRILPDVLPWNDRRNDLEYWSRDQPR